MRGSGNFLPSRASRVPEVEAYLELWQQREGVRLTAGQKAEVIQELAGRRGVALTIGDPGTAKTSTLAIVEHFDEEVLRPEGREHLSVNLSYTGKAARELSLATDKPALTLDSFENANPASKFALQRANGKPPMVVVAGEIILIPQGGKRRLCSGWTRRAFSGRGRRNISWTRPRSLGKAAPGEASSPGATRNRCRESRRGTCCARCGSWASKRRSTTRT